jgi:hypothetical protein
LTGADDLLVVLRGDVADPELEPLLVRAVLAPDRAAPPLRGATSARTTGDIPVPLHRSPFLFSC